MFPYKPCRSEWVTIDAERAAKLLSCNYEDQRVLRVGHVATLRIAMLEDRHKPRVIEVVHCKEDGKANLIDGQHCLTAITKSGTSELLQLWEWEVDTKVEVDMLYSITDAGKARSIIDRISALIHEFSSEEASRVGGSVLWAENGFKSTTYGTDERAISQDPVERAQRVRQYAEEYKAVKEGFGTSGSIHHPLRRTPVLSVWLQVMLYQPEKAKKLIAEIRENDRLEKYSAAWNYREKVLPDTAVVRQGADRKSLTDAQKSRYLAAIWNSYYEGKLLIRVQPREISEPFLLLGTPWNGKQK